MIRFTNRGRTVVMDYATFRTLDPYAVSAYLRGQAASPLVRL
jgi:hypothetical protein